MEHYSFQRQVLHKIKNYLSVKLAVAGAGMKYSLAVDKKHLAGLACDDRHGQGIDTDAGKGLGKYFRAAHNRKYISVAVIVDLRDLDRARKHDAEVLGRVALGENRVFFIKMLDLGAEAGEYPHNVIGGDIIEKRTFFQNVNV